MPSEAASSAKSSSTAWNRSLSKPTRSILFTASSTRGTRSRALTAVCRRVCSERPLRASTRITASCAVEAPVTMFRVYCTWPGVSARMKRRRGVAKYRYATSMVMPCSRSDRSPSVSSARSVSSRPRSRLVRWTASYWSASTDLVSYSSRPTRVDLPSSTEPAVARRKRADTWVAGSAGASRSTVILEVALSLAVFHGGLGKAVVGAGGPALGDPRRADLLDDVQDADGDRVHGAGAGHVADRAVPDVADLDALAVARPAPVARREAHS